MRRPQQVWTRAIAPFVLVAEAGDGDCLLVLFADAPLLHGAALAVFGRGPLKLGSAVVGVDDLHAEDAFLPCGHSQ